MRTIDRQRIEAVRVLEGSGYTFRDGAWLPPICRGSPTLRVCDALHGILADRAEALTGYTEGSPEAEELATIAAALDAYEDARWPGGKIPGGKG
jgi:hypothetical protein